jgi:nitrite reductase/ring-hydroxylating ferredoxin subunit
MAKDNREPVRTRFIVGRLDKIPPGASVKFLLRIGRNREECFAINFEGRLYGYVNRCCHVPVALDWVENQFFTADGRFLRCQTHNALYLPDSGECIDGPAAACGKYLRRVPIEVRDGIIYAALPNDRPDRTDSH